MNPKLFTSPYSSIPDDLINHSSVDLSVADCQLLKSVMPTRGGIQTTIQLLVHKTCNELRKRSITDYTHDDAFRACVGGLCSADHPSIGAAFDTILGLSAPSGLPVGGTVVDAHAEASVRDDGRRAEIVDRQPPGKTHVPADVQSGTPVGGGNRGTGGGKDPARAKGKVVTRRTKG
jgi:hypothetical protein